VHLAVTVPGELHPHVLSNVGVGKFAHVCVAQTVEPFLMCCAPAAIAMRNWGERSWELSIMSRTLKSLYPLRGFSKTGV